jgi:hypothetical protein
MTTILQRKGRRTWVLVCYLFQILSASAHSSILDGFIDDQDQEHDEGVPQQHLSWRNLSDREEGLGVFLDRILERSRNARQAVSVAGNSAEDAIYTILDARSPPTLSDYPLWRVRCRVSPTIISGIMEIY